MRATPGKLPIEPFARLRNLAILAYYLSIIRSFAPWIPPTA